MLRASRGFWLEDEEKGEGEDAAARPERYGPRGFLEEEEPAVQRMKELHRRLRKAVSDEIAEEDEFAPYDFTDSRDVGIAHVIGTAGIVYRDTRRGEKFNKRLS